MYFIPLILALKRDKNYKIRIHFYFSKGISIKICDEAPQLYMLSFLRIFYLLQHYSVLTLSLVREITTVEKT